MFVALISYLLFFLKNSEIFTFIVCCVQLISATHLVFNFFPAARPDIPPDIPTPAPTFAPATVAPYLPFSEIMYEKR